ncbi:mediator of RNA polymerase II transcription subunit 20a-like [Abrus precatorius]|uniref:Mediator of RNA polymerase II transcription subunit 20 n=1 Tax=Abrus precatorius TaxID=3816 RepID=A0A8B8JLQ7_ABRPR|nr:mediator of RNA polymerase II transcription subunit 20a-like [Abrus precatorius]
MPVRCILLWQPNQGGVNSVVLNEISHCIETLNGVKDGRMKASLTFYKPNLREQNVTMDFPRDFLGMSMLEQPNKYYFIIRGQKIVLEADSSILTIMEKLQSYKCRIALNFEGVQYKLGDFQMRVIKVVPLQGEGLKGIMIEIEYLPISSVEKSKQIMEEFVEMWKEVASKNSLAGQFIHVEPNYAEYGLSDTFTSQHTAVQYAAALAQLIQSSAQLIQSSAQLRN